MPVPAALPTAKFMASMKSCVASLVGDDRDAKTVRVGAHLGWFNGNDPLKNALLPQLNRMKGDLQSQRNMAVLLVEPQPHAVPISLVV